jgi:integrase
VAQQYIYVRHRKACRATGKTPRACSCAPAVAVQVNRVWQDDLKGVLPKGWSLKDLAELEAEARRRGLDHDSGRRLIERGSTPTLGELGEEFLADVRRDQQLGDYAHNTVKTYESVWRAMLEPAFGDKPVTAITRELVTDQRAKWAAEGKARNYITTSTSLLSTILADKAMPRFITTNPCTIVGRRKRRGRSAAARPARQPRALSTEFVFKLLDAARVREDDMLLHDMILCAVTTGMREREVAGLKPEYVDLRNHRIEVAGQYIRDRTWEPTKSGEERTTVACDLLAERLRVRMENCGEYVFGYPARWHRLNGLPMSTRSQSAFFRDLWDATGPRNKGEGWHALRHTFSTILDRHRIRPLAIDAVMGHKNKGVSFRYQHVLDDELNTIVAALNVEFDRTPPDVVRLDDHRRKAA